MPGAAPEATLGSALCTLSLRGASPQELAEFRFSFEADTAWWAARRADADDIEVLELLVAQTRQLLKQATDDWTQLTEANARWHEALARAAGTGTAGNSRPSSVSRCSIDTALHLLGELGQRREI